MVRVCTCFGLKRQADPVVFHAFPASAAGCIWKNTETRRWARATCPLCSAALQGEPKDLEALESCQRHADRATSPGISCHFKSLLPLPS